MTRAGTAWSPLSALGRASALLLRVHERPQRRGEKARTGGGRWAVYEAAREPHSAAEADMEGWRAGQRSAMVALVCRKGGTAGWHELSRVSDLRYDGCGLGISP